MKARREIKTLLLAGVLSLGGVVGTNVVYNQVHPVEAASVTTIIKTGTTTIGLNIRKGGSTKYEKVGYVKKGAKVEIIGQSSTGWYKIKYDNIIGYISNAYVNNVINVESTLPTTTSTKLSVSTTGTVVNTSTLSVRKGDKTTYSKIGSLKRGEIVTVLGKTSNDWYKIKYGNTTGYVHGSYLKVSTSIKAESEEGKLLYEEMKQIVKVNSGNLTRLVNRSKKLSSSYIPSDLVKATVKTTKTVYVKKEILKPLTDMFNDAKKNNVYLALVSGYRSYSYQNTVYKNALATRGQAYVDKFIAKPGQSEHQTGLAVDLSAKSVGWGLEDNFCDTTEGKWLAKNAHKYGFILRYTESRINDTGYSYEPWHFRYVGKEVATYIYENNLILEDLF